MSESPLLPRTLYIEQFLPLKGRTFQAHCEPRTAELTLVDVQPSRERVGGEGIGFSLIFQSTPQVLLTAGMYPLKSGSFGPEVIYLEPTTAPPGDGPPGYFYQAIFN